jgi:hypothetical protein
VEPATERDLAGRPWCAVCAAEVALEAERVLQRMREALRQNPRIARDVARARGVVVEAANDVVVGR